MGQFDTLDDVIGVLRRRFALILGITLIGAALSLIYAGSLPRIYETTAIIQIELPNITENTGGQSAGSRAKHRLNLIKQQLMARGALESVVEELHLFSETGLSDFEKMDALRQSVTIAQIIDPADTWRPDAVPSGLLITVQFGDPDQAALIANTFLNRILTQSDERRQEQAGAALTFFESEAARVDAKIVETESEIATFKQENAASLPAGTSSLRDQLGSLKETELEIERQLIGLKTNSARVREDVLTRQISELEEQNNLVLQRISVLEAALAAAPEVERAFSQLSRQLEQLNEQFTIITRRRAEAEMGLMLESSQQSERFDVLEVALVPDYPVSPSRKKITLAGTALFFALGAGLAILLEVLNPSIRTSAQLERELGVVPIVTIPNLDDKSRSKSKTKGWLAWIAALLVGLGVVAYPILKRMVEFIGASVKSIFARISASKRPALRR